MLAAGTASATIDRIDVCGEWFIGNTIPTNRGSNNFIKVYGFGVDLATRVETTIQGATATIKERKGGSGSYVVINLAIPKGDAVFGARVSLRYAIEVAGPDTFLVDAHPIPKVNSLSFQSGPGVSTVNGVPTLTTGDPHILVLRGQYLNNLDPSETLFENSGMRNVSVVLRQADEVRISLTPATAKSYSIEPALFSVACDASLENFSISFTGVDRPRTPTPTVTPTRTPTRPPLSLPPRLTPVVPPILIGPTPTRTPTPIKRTSGP